MARVANQLKYDGRIEVILLVLIPNISSISYQYKERIKSLSSKGLICLTEHLNVIRSYADLERYLQKGTYLINEL